MCPGGPLRKRQDELDKFCRFTNDCRSEGRPVGLGQRIKVEKRKILSIHNCVDNKT